MAWLKTNWGWAALNLAALSILVVILGQGRSDWNTIPTFDPGLESGKWAIRLLLICLSMSPLYGYFGWSGAIKLRKPAGLWAFGFALAHALFTLWETPWGWLSWPLHSFIVLGLLGLLILSLLAITSNRWAMRRLKRYWKRLHRLVYVAGLAVVYHAILATEASKKLFVYDPQAITELNIYLALLVVLLVVRPSPVRRLLKSIPARLRPQPQVDRAVVPDPIPEYRPVIYDSQVGILLDDLLAEVEEEEKIRLGIR